MASKREVSSGSQNIGEKISIDSQRQKGTPTTISKNKVHQLEKPLILCAPPIKARVMPKYVELLVNSRTLLGGTLQYECPQCTYKQTCTETLKRHFSNKHLRLVASWSPSEPEVKRKKVLE